MSFKVIQTENEKKARNFSNSFSTQKKKKKTHFNKNKSKNPKNKTTPQQKATYKTWVFDDKVKEATGCMALCSKDTNCKNLKLTTFCDFMEHNSGLLRRNSFWDTKKPLSLYLSTMSFEQELVRAFIINSIPVTLKLSYFENY
jgi:hypothetical protein